MLAFRRFLPVLLTPLLAIVLTGWLQSAGPTERQPDTGRKTTKKPPEEEEEPIKGRPKVPLRVDDEPGQPLLMTALQREADQAKPGPVQDIYRRLAVAHDEVRFPDNQPILWIVPLPSLTFDKIEVQGIDPRGKLTKKVTLDRKAIAGIDAYESVALVQVERFLDETAKTLPSVERLHHAETILAEVLRAHRSAREQLRRTGTGWADIEKQLYDRLLAVRLKRLAESEDSETASKLANQLVETYPDQKDVRSAVLRTAAGQLERMLLNDKLQTFADVRKELDKLERQFPQSATEPTVAKVRAALEAKAIEVLKRVAEFAPANGDKAREQLAWAGKIWPQSPQVAEWRARLNVTQPLYIGVPQLPENLSPLSANTEAERQALDLLFESLIAPEPDAGVGQVYQPGLALGAPTVLPAAREFRLVPDARWYGFVTRGSKSEPVDEPVNAADVLSTVSAYKSWFPNDPDWAALSTESRDPSRVTLGMPPGSFDPLSLMSFKVMPAKYLNDRAFAQHPIGSGPYYYNGRQKDKSGTTYAEFLANPTYGSRSGKANTLAIHDIRMVIDTKPQDFLNRRVSLAIGLRTQQLPELQSGAAGLDAVKVVTLANRRVYFLAINHRKAPLQNKDLRRAIALAIDRDKILDRNFRNESGKFHHALNGPFPAGSWACNDKEQEVPARLFQEEKAKYLATQAKAAGVKLKLAYPAGQPDVEAACRDIADMVKQRLGVEIEPVAQSAADLRDDVEIFHTYDLAYCAWDYTDSSFDLWPLFAPGPERGSGEATRSRNILGPINDADLDTLFHKLQGRRQFAEVKRLNQAIHRQIYETMPLVPLWQLDTHIAVRAGLTTVPEVDKLDAQHLFRHIDAWRLDNR